MCFVKRFVTKHLENIQAISFLQHYWNNYWHAVVEVMVFTTEEIILFLILLIYLSELRCINCCKVRSSVIELFCIHWLSILSCHLSASVWPDIWNNDFEWNSSFRCLISHVCFLSLEVVTREGMVGTQLPDITFSDVVRQKICWYPRLRVGLFIFIATNIVSVKILDVDNVFNDITEGNI